MRQIEFFILQKEILEELFSSEWLSITREKSHSAYLRWTLCNEIIEQKGIIKFPEQEEKLPEIGRIVLDSYILVRLTKGDLQQLKSWSFDSYRDKVVQKKIHSRIRDPRQYEDLMVELYIGAWHKTKNHFVNPIEKEGYPDLKIEIPGVNAPIFVECKHLWTGSENHLRKVIKKANNQIKKTAEETKIPSYGAVILDVSIPVAVGQVENDNLSDELQEIIDGAQLALSGRKNRSVGAATVIWDDCMIMGKPPADTLVAWRRRCKRISHEKSALNIPEKVPLFEGYTTTFRLDWMSREKQSKKDKKNKICPDDVMNEADRKDEI